MFGYRVKFSGTADLIGAIFDSNKFKMAAAAILDYFEWPIDIMNIIVMGQPALFMMSMEWPYHRNSSRSTYIARIARSSLR